MRARGKTVKDPGFYLAGFCALGFREGSVFMFVLFQKNTLGFQQVVYVGGRRPLGLRNAPTPKYLFGSSSQ